MVDAHVVILNWNNAGDTIECLESLITQKDVSLEYIIVDNCSRDDSVQRIRERFPYISIIENERNLGFPAGMNVGIRFALACGAKNILMLNNDTIAIQGMLRQLLSSLSPDVGMVAPAIFYASQPDQIWSIGGKIHPLLMEMVEPFGRKDSPLTNPVERDFVTGCAMMVRSEVFYDVGLFDERFFPGYYEDLDFCLRIRQKGIRVILVPQAHLLHKISQASGGQFSPRVYYLMGRNSGYYFRKHMLFWQAPFIITYRLLSALKASARLIVRKNWPCLHAYWSGLVRGWTGLLAKSGERYISFYQKG